MNLAVITARAGSKRIKNKNIKNFCGKPIIEYSIKAALEAGCFDEVMVSTDSSEIAELSKTAGASVPFLRSKEKSDDYTTTAEVLLEVLNKYEEAGYKVDNLFCIYPTAPFITSEKIKTAMDALQNQGYKSVIPVVKFSFPPQRAFKCTDGMIGILDPDSFYKRSQDLEPIYHDAGQFYGIKTDAFKTEKSLITDNSKAILMQESEVQDIDTIEDWKLAELKYKLLKDEI